MESLVPGWWHTTRTDVACMSCNCLGMSLMATGGTLVFVRLFIRFAGCATGAAAGLTTSDEAQLGKRLLVCHLCGCRQLVWCWMGTLSGVVCCWQCTLMPFCAVRYIVSAAQANFVLEALYAPIGTCLEQEVYD